MKYIVVNGIGETQAGWAKDLYIELGCRPNDIIEINWEDNIKRTPFDCLLRYWLSLSPLSKSLAQHGADIPRYFFDQRLRKSIVDEVAFSMNLLNEPFYLVGFGLGSVIALETLASIDQSDVMCAGLITLGSPIDQPVIRRLIHHPKKMSRVWLNLWSAQDPISTRIRVNYAAVLNFAVDVRHDFNAYMAKTREILSKDTL